MAIVEDDELPQFNIKIPRGMTKSYQIAVTAALVAGGPQMPVNLLNKTLTFLVKTARTLNNLPVPDSAALLTKTLGNGGIVITDLANGLAVVTITAADCADPTLFPENVNLFWGVKLYPDEAELNWGYFRVQTYPNLT